MKSQAKVKRKEVMPNIRMPNVIMSRVSFWSPARPARTWKIIVTVNPTDVKSPMFW